jgi:CysZ protein
VRFVRRNRGLAIGNGTVYLLLLLSVVGFLVALPLATVAGCAAVRPLLEREGR